MRLSATSLSSLSSFSSLGSLVILGREGPERPERPERGRASEDVRLSALLLPSAWHRRAVKCCPRLLFCLTGHFFLLSIDFLNSFCYFCRLFIKIYGKEY